MRQIVSFVVVCALSLGTSFAQEWRTFTSMEDRFSANFPGEPEVAEILWESEYGAMLPGRVYTVEQGASKYSATVVDYNPIEEILTEKGKTCPPGLEGCEGTTAARRSDNNGAGYWKTDIRGAMIYVTSQYLKRDVTVTDYMWNWLGQGPEVHQLQLINNADQARIFVNIYMHHNWLYILEETAPENGPPPAIFHQSISLFEEDGSRASHGGLYFNAPEVDPDQKFTFGGGPN